MWASGAGSFDDVRRSESRSVSFPSQGTMTVAVDEVATRQPGLPRSAGLWPGDMMIDWVSSRPAGGCGRSFFSGRPMPALHRRSGAADSVLAGAGRGRFPIG